MGLTGDGSLFLPEPKGSPCWTVSSGPLLDSSGISIGSCGWELSQLSVTRGENDINLTFWNANIKPCICPGLPNSI